jgi:hypothetical protein
VVPREKKELKPWYKCHRNFPVVYREFWQHSKAHRELTPQPSRAANVGSKYGDELLARLAANAAGSSRLGVRLLTSARAGLRQSTGLLSRPVLHGLQCRCIWMRQGFRVFSGLMSGSVSHGLWFYCVCMRQRFRVFFDLQEKVFFLSKKKKSQGRHPYGLSFFNPSIRNSYTVKLRALFFKLIQGSFKVT